MTVRSKLQLKPTSVTPQAESPAVVPPQPIEKADRPDRAGKKLIAGHFPASVARRLKVLAATNDRTVQSLLDEALTDLLHKYGQ